MISKNSFWAALTLVLGLFMTTPLVKAQGFVRSYGQAGVNEGGSGLVPLDNDRLLLYGFRGDSTIFLFMDALGNVSQSRTVKFVSGNLADRVEDVILDSGGNLVGVGTAVSGNAPTKGFVFRYDFNNNAILWSNEWTTITYARAALEVTPGEILVCGADYGAGSNGVDGYLGTFDLTTGANVQSYRYTALSAEDFKNIVQVGTDLYAGGRLSSTGGFSGMRPAISAFNSSLDVQYAKSYFVPLTTGARMYTEDLDSASDSTLVMASWGDNSGTSITATEAYVSYHNLNGDMLWGNQYDISGTGSERAKDCMAADNQLIVQGSMDDGYGSVFLMALDYAGGVNWCHSYPGISEQRSFSNRRILYWKGHIYFTAANTQVPQDDDISLVRVLPDGTFGESKCSFSPHTVSLQNYTTAFNTNLVRNSSQVAFSTTSAPLAATNLADSVICGDVRLSFPGAENRDSQVLVYPNPASKLISFEISAPHNRIAIRLYDLEGRAVHVQNSASPIDISELPIGIYAMVITIDGSQVHRKVVVQ